MIKNQKMPDTQPYKIKKWVKDGLVEILWYENDRGREQMQY